FFFFQAEDGIRVRNVTGVQTCALPISTPAPRLYTRGLEVEVSDADVIDTSVPDGFGQDVMTLHGTVEEAYLSPFVDSGLRYGGGLGWAAEHEIHLVV